MKMKRKKLKNYGLITYTLLKMFKLNLLCKDYFKKPAQNEEKIVQKIAGYSLERAQDIFNFKHENVMCISFPEGIVIIVGKGIQKYPKVGVFATMPHAKSMKGEKCFFLLIHDFSKTKENTPEHIEVAYNICKTKKNGALIQNFTQRVLTRYHSIPRSIWMQKMEEIFSTTKKT